MLQWPTSEAVEALADVAKFYCDEKELEPMLLNDSIVFSHDGDGALNAWQILWQIDGLLSNVPEYKGEDKKIGNNVSYINNGDKLNDALTRKFGIDPANPEGLRIYESGNTSAFPTADELEDNRDDEEVYITGEDRYISMEDFLKKYGDHVSENLDEGTSKIVSRAKQAQLNSSALNYVSEEEVNTAYESIVQAKSYPDFAYIFGKESDARKVAAFNKGGIIVVLKNDEEVPGNDFGFSQKSAKTNEQIVIHEVNHTLGNVLANDPYKYETINEAATELITERQLPNAERYASYSKPVAILEAVVDGLNQSGYDGEDVLMRSYYGKDPTILKDAVDDCGGEGCYEKITRLMYLAEKEGYGISPEVREALKETLQEKLHVDAEKTRILEVPEDNI